jgi:CheY-like chemotaxis protein
VARVIALVPDLLFGSQVQGSLKAAGHDVALAGDEAKVRERLAEGGAEAGGEGGDKAGAAAPEGMEPGAGDGTVLVIDLTDDRFDGAAILEALVADGALAGVSTLAFYSHVDAAVRERALQAGFDLVVPRSRMAREGPALVGGLAGGAAAGAG